MARPLRLLLAMAGIVLMGFLGLPAVAQQAEHPRQPAAWCARWTDDCTVCTRGAGGAEASCKSRPGRCVAGAVRCVMENAAELRAACESPRIVRESCNSCARDSQGRETMCTLKLCPVRNIVCERPRANPPQPPG